MGGIACIIKHSQITSPSRYKALETPKDCGGEIQASSDGRLEGEVSSPNYGHQYFPNLDCLWILNVSTVANSTNPHAVEDMKVGVEFVDFDIATTVTQYSQELFTFPDTKITSCRGYICYSR